MKRLHRRKTLGIVAITILVLWVLWDLISPKDRPGAAASCGGSIGDLLRCPATFSALHSVAAGTLQAVLVLLAAWAFYNDKRDRRETLIADSTVSIGLAGTVLPLLTVAFVMAWLATPAPADATGRPRANPFPAHRRQGPDSYLSLLRIESSGTQGPLKWARGHVRAGTWPNAEQMQITPGLVSMTEADLVDEAIRQIVGTVRDWASVFSASDLGRASAHLVQSLHREAQELDRKMREVSSSNGAPDRKQVAHLDALRLAVLDKAMVLQVAFEDASGPLHRRPEVDHAFDHAKSHLPDAPWLTRYGESVTSSDQAIRALEARAWLASQSSGLLELTAVR